MNIATIITCFNRKNQTLSCLKNLYASLDSYNANTKEEKLSLSMFMTDDGCTDGTSDAVRENFYDKDIVILKGNGNLFWAGGMRVAWNAAINSNKAFDFYLLLNDDTDFIENTFSELLATHQYSIEKYGKAGLYSGITSAKNDFNRITYGGDIWTNKFLAKSIRLSPAGVPQKCDITNANILLVSNDVVNSIGIFSDKYIHGIADNDYSIKANKAGFPVLVTANICGRCDYDHESNEEVFEKISKMSLKERKEYYKHPLHSNKDYLTFIKENSPIRYPIVVVGRFLNTYFPSLYYWVSKIR